MNKRIFSYLLVICTLCLIGCSTQSEENTNQGIVASSNTSATTKSVNNVASNNNSQAENHNMPIKVTKKKPKKKRKAFKGSKLFNLPSNSAQAKLADFLEGSSLEAPQTFVLGNKANNQKLVKEIGSILAAYPHAKVALTDGTKANTKGKQFQNALLKLGISDKQFVTGVVTTNSPKGKLALQVIKK